MQCRNGVEESLDLKFERKFVKLEPRMFAVEFRGWLKKKSNHVNFAAKAKTFMVESCDYLEVKIIKTVVQM